MYNNNIIIIVFIVCTNSKHQLVKPVTCGMKLKAVEKMLLERDNYELLQTPWLSEVC